MDPAPPSRPKRSWKRRLRNWAVALVVLYGVWCMALRWLESKLLYPTYMIGARPALHLDERGPVRRVEVPGPEGAVETLVVYPRNTRVRSPALWRSSSTATRNWRATTSTAR